MGWTVVRNGRPSREMLPMGRNGYDHFDLAIHDGVAVATVVSPEIRHPGPAQELGAELASLLDRDQHRRIVVNLSHTHYLSSTAFATLLGFARKVEAAHGQLAIAGMQPDVLVGANIIGLGRIVGIHPDVPSALESFGA